MVFMATLKMLDPRGSVKTKDRPLVVGLDTLEGKVIGIIDNGQANSTTMFQELAKLLEEKYRPAEVLFKTKPTHMQGAPKATMEEFVNRCDAVITGLGA
jgi:predicted GTPase